MVLSTEHYYGRKRNKYRTVQFFNESLRANRNLQQIDVCIQEFLGIEALSEIQYFIFLSKKISAEFIIEQKL